MVIIAARAIVQSLIEDLVGCPSAGCSVHSVGTDYCKGAGQKGRVGFRFEKLQA